MRVSTNTLVLLLVLGLFLGTSALHLKKNSPKSHHKRHDPHAAITAFLKKNELDPDDVPDGEPQGDLPEGFTEVLEPLETSATVAPAGDSLNPQPIEVEAPLAPDEEDVLQDIEAEREHRMAFQERLFVDVRTLPKDNFGFFQLLFLTSVYGYILFTASNMISDGSELLLLIPAWAGIVGSVVLPILGAVPDGAMVLFSGLGEDVAEKVSVGVGALAGSTIMLLTISYGSAVVAGRVDLDEDGNAAYNRPSGERLTKGCTLFGTGVAPNISIKNNAYIMLATSASYLIIQGPSTMLHCYYSEDKTCDARGQKWWAFFGMIVCAMYFVFYLVYQVYYTDDQKDDKKTAVIKENIAKGHISIRAAFYQFVEASDVDKKDLEEAKAAGDEKVMKTVLRSFFNKHDADSNNMIDKGELRAMLRDNAESVADDDEAFNALWQTHNGSKTEMDFPAFDKLVVSLLKEEAKPSLEKQPSVKVAEESDDEDEEGLDWMNTAEWKNMDPKRQQRIIMRTAFGTMALGTFLVLMFSDPMVGCMSEFGNRINVPPFYISFILAPLASNASEVIASAKYAMKKTCTTISISLAALEGAASMNNTFCLGIFLGLIFFRGLAWTFTAETLTIVLVEVLVGAVAIRPVQTLGAALFVLALYPLSLTLIFLLEQRPSPGLN